MNHSMEATVEKVVNVMNEEKRRARRFDLALPVTVLAAGRRKPQLAVHSRDISSSGILLEFEENLTPGTSMELEITLPGEITQAGPVRVRCLGHVVRVTRGDRTGVAVSIERYEFMRLHQDRPGPTSVQ